jgi:hypothetical protein
METPDKKYYAPSHRNAALSAQGDVKPLSKRGDAEAFGPLGICTSECFAPFSRCEALTVKSPKRLA